MLFLFCTVLHFALWETECLKTFFLNEQEKRKYIIFYFTCSGAWRCDSTSWEVSEMLSWRNAESIHALHTLAICSEQKENVKTTSASGICSPGTILVWKYCICFDRGLQTKHDKLNKILWNIVVCLLSDNKCWICRPRYCDCWAPWNSYSSTAIIKQSVEKSLIVRYYVGILRYNRIEESERIQRSNY